MQAETEPTVGLPPTRDYKLGFMSRRRRLRNRWNIHMRKDDRAQVKTDSQSSAGSRVDNAPGGLVKPQQS